MIRILSFGLCKTGHFLLDRPLYIIRVFWQILHYKCRNLGCSSAEGRSSTANSGTKAVVLPGIVVLFAGFYDTFLTSYVISVVSDIEREKSDKFC